MQIFLLILPQTNRQLALLVTLCVMAPILNWAGDLVGSELPHDLRSGDRYDCHDVPMRMHS